MRNAAIQYHVFSKDRGRRIPGHIFVGEGQSELFWGYARLAKAVDPENLSSALLKDLYRTQLLRVDRMGMAHTIEIHVSFFDSL